MKKFKQSIVSIVIGLALAASLSYAAPTANPPNNNIFAPINVSATPQTKPGSLTVSNFTDSLNTILSGSVTVGTAGSDNILTVNGILQVKGSTPSTISVTGGEPPIISGSYTIRTFNVGGTLGVTGGSIDIDYLGVGGGGGGGYGGGGAGGYQTGTRTLAPGSYSVTIGLGGPGRASGTDDSSNGGESSFAGIISEGGGGGGVWGNDGNSGGSGGGGGKSGNGGNGIGGQGNNGGNGKGGNSCSNCGGGGGGGFTTVGSDGTRTAGGTGGAGGVFNLAIYAGGGGGGTKNGGTVGAGGAGAGGGGAGGNGKTVYATAGALNRGGGGGGGGRTSGGTNRAGAAGGSGVGIVKYWTNPPSATDAIVTDSNGNVAIGKDTTTTGTKLDVAGNINTQSLTVNGVLKIPAGKGAGKVLVSDANGVGTWKSKTDFCL